MAEYLPIELFSAISRNTRVQDRKTGIKHTEGMIKTKSSKRVQFVQKVIFHFPGIQFIADAL